MKMRTTVALALFVLILVTAIYSWERHRRGSDDVLAHTLRVFDEISSETIESIEIRRASSRLRIERAGMRWRIVEPIDDDADLLAIEEFIKAVNRLSRSAVVPASDILGGDEATGLGARAVHVEIEGRESESLAFSVGAAPIPGGQRYLRVEGSDLIRIVLGDLPAIVEAPVDHWRSRRLLGRSSIGIRRVVIEGKLERPLTFERRDGDFWWLTGGLEDEADSRRFGDWLAKISFLEVESFLPSRNDAANAVTPKRQWLITLDLAPRDRDPHDRQHIEIRFVPSPDYAHLQDVVVSGRAGVMRVRAASLLAQIDRAPATWRSKTVIDFSPWDIDGFELRDRDKIVSARRIGRHDAAKASWRVDPKHSSGNIDQLTDERINAFLSHIARIDALRIDDEVDAKQAGLAPPVRTLTLRFIDSRRPERTLDLGRSAHDDGVYVRRRDRPSLFVIRAEDAAAVVSLLRSPLKPSKHDG